MAAEGAAAVVAATTTRTAFAWQHAPQPWHQLLVLLAAAGLAWWAWRRYGPAPAGAAGRIARLCRVAALLLAVVMLAGPAWRTTATSVLPARIAVAIDRSASMARADLPDGRPRIALAGDLARELGAVSAARGLALAWRGIGGAPGELSGAELLRAPPAATGAASALADDCLALIAGERPDHLVLLSDGRITDGARFAALAEELKARGIQVSVLEAGGETVDPGLWLDEVEANKDAAFEESEPVVVRASARALPDGPTTVRLLVDGVLVDEHPATVPPPGAPNAPSVIEERLAATFHKRGPAKLRVEIEHGALRDARDIAVTVAERKLQVLLLEGRPRYESRYLREALRRDHTITVHAYLLDGRPKRWQTEGPADHVPLGAHELRDYDAVIIGDIGPDQLPQPDADLEALSRAVREAGIGLVWIPGESGATARFARSKLGADLLPVEIPDEPALGGGYRAGVPRRLTRTAVAEAQRLLDSGGVAWSELPPLIGAAPLTAERVRKGADVLMTDQDGAPVVVARDLEAGRTLLIGVDDTWRWRRNVGDRYLHRFHSQLLRYAAARRQQNPNGWRLVTTPHRAVPGETVALALLSGAARLRRSAPSTPSPGWPGPTGREQRIELVREGGGFSATLPAPSVGTWTVDLIDGPNPAETEAGELVVLPPTSEARDPRADPLALAELARATGGEVFSDARALVAALPDKRQVREDVLPAHGLWDTGWALAALVALLAIEWSLRRINRLP